MAALRYALLGHTNVGKSSYLRSLTDKIQINKNDSSIEATINLNGHEIILQECTFLKKKTFDGAIIMASNDRASIRDVRRWIQEFRAISQSPIVLVINKLDLKLPRDEIEKALQDYPYLPHYISVRYKENLEGPLLSLLVQS